jgi:hypothetical protein
MPVELISSLIASTAMLLSSSISVLSSIALTIIVYLVFEKSLAKVKAEYDYLAKRNLNRQLPSNDKLFEGNYSFLEKLNLIREKVVEFYVNEPAQDLFNLTLYSFGFNSDFEGRFIAPPEVLQEYNRSKSNYSKFFSLYDAYVSKERIDSFNSSIELEMKDFRNSFPLLDTELEEIGDKFFDQCKYFSHSDNFRELKISINTKEVDTFVLYDLFVRFQEQTKASFDSEFMKVKKVFKSIYDLS